MLNLYFYWRIQTELAQVWFPKSVEKLSKVSFINLNVDLVILQPLHRFRVLELSLCVQLTVIYRVDYVIQSNPSKTGAVRIKFSSRSPKIRVPLIIFFQEFKKKQSFWALSSVLIVIVRYRHVNAR